MRYAVTLAPDDGAFLVTVPDLPAVTTDGRDVEHARAQALDAILTVFSYAIRTRQAIPLPTATGRVWVTIPASVQAKVYLHNAMVAADVTQAELARRLGLHRQQVARLLDVDHPSTLGQLTAALAAVGRELLLQDAEVWRPQPVPAMRDIVGRIEGEDAPPAPRPKAKKSNKTARRK